MITHIRTVGFKGFDLDEDVPEKVIYSGKNKSGKSTRAAAIAFTLLGNVPWATSGKLPSDILNSFGSDMIAGEVTISGTRLGKRLKRNAEGKVSQSFQLDGKVTSKDNFMAMLGKVGSPKIADTAEFMKQSETKKVDTLFDIYPNPELQMIDTAISNAKEDVSRIEKKITGADSTIARLTASKSEIVMPSGTIASVQDEIKNIDSQISDLEKQIKEAEIEEAKTKAVEEERERIANEQSQKGQESYGDPMYIGVDMASGEDQHAEIPLKTDEDWKRSGIDSIPDSSEMAEIDQVISKMEKDLSSVGYSTNAEIIYSPIESIQRIIDALNGSGCSTCAALIVAKQELKKFGGV